MLKKEQPKITHDTISQNLYKIAISKYPEGPSNPNITDYALDKVHKLKIFVEYRSDKSKAAYRLKIKKLMRQREDTRCN